MAAIASERADSGALDVVPGWLLDPLIPSQLTLITTLGEFSEVEFGYVETSILDMQKKIFTDQMPMHEAYLDLGMDGIQEMHAAGLIDGDMLAAWQNIDSGDPDLVAQGNPALLYREQHAVIGDDYDDMRNHDGPVGEAMTYMMGAIGSPGIPGAETLGEYDPLKFGGTAELRVPLAPNPYGTLEVATPLPEGNISNAETRWDLIEHDILPAFQDLVKDHPDEVTAILDADVQDRIDDARLVNNIGDLIDRLSDFDVHGGRRPRHRRRRPPELERQVGGVGDHRRRQDGLHEESDRLRGGRLQVVHQGVSGSNYVHLILSWRA